MIIKRPMVVLQRVSNPEDYWITEKTPYNHNQELLEETAKSTDSTIRFNFIKEFTTEVQI